MFNRIRLTSSFLLPGGGRTLVVVVVIVAVLSIARFFLYELLFVDVNNKRDICPQLGGFR